jgi:hypothetical protein
MTDKQLKYIKTKLRKETPNMVSGYWCFYKRKTKPKCDRAFRYKQQWYAVTYQTGYNFDFWVRV